MNLGATAMNVAANRLNKAPSLLMHDGSMNQFGTTADFHLRQRAGGIGLRKLRHAAGHLGYKSAKIGGVGSLTEFPKAALMKRRCKNRRHCTTGLQKLGKLPLRLSAIFTRLLGPRPIDFPMVIIHYTCMVDANDWRGSLGLQ